MTSKTNPWINLPGETGRDYWRREADNTWVRLDGVPDGPGGIVAIEAAALDSAPLWALAPADVSVDIENVALLKWEGLGLEPPAEGKSWASWKVHQGNGRVLVGSVALADASVQSWADLRPADFEISAKLFPLPEGEAALWMEEGRYVLAVNRGEILVHTCLLAERTLGLEAAQEIRDLMISLEVNEFITALKGLRIWTEAPAGFKQQCKDVLATRVRVEAKPAPCLPRERTDILPPEVAMARQQAAALKRKVQIIATLATLYVLFFACWSGYLFWKQSKLNARATEFARSRPEVEQVRQARDHWLALESATNPDTYPAEVFHRLAALLPAEGVQFEMFDMKDDHVMIKGIASSPHIAGQFKQDIQNSPALADYAWNFPPPVSKSDGRASFWTEGVAKGGSGHP